MAVTTTVTRGSALYFFSLSVSESASCLGVRPEACTSSTRGREIFPSGRTGRVAVISASLQTAMWSTSSGPITYSGPARLAEAAAGILSEAVLSEAGLAGGGAGGSCASAMLLIKTSAATVAFHSDFISSDPLSSQVCNLEPLPSGSVPFVPNLLQLVEQCFVADLQLLRGPAPIPAGASQNLKNEFPLRFAGSCARRIFER